MQVILLATWATVSFLKRSLLYAVRQTTLALSSGQLSTHDMQQSPKCCNCGSRSKEGEKVVLEWLTLCEKHTDTHKGRNLIRGCYCRCPNFTLTWMLSQPNLTRRRESDIVSASASFTSVCSLADDSHKHWLPKPSLRCVSDASQYLSNSSQVVSALN